MTKHWKPLQLVALALGLLLVSTACGGPAGTPNRDNETPAGEVSPEGEEDEDEDDEDEDD